MSKKKTSILINRYEKILKISDKQQFYILQNKEKINKEYQYNIKQQIIAKNKLERLIENQLNLKTIFKASDILSGDFYSTFKLKNGNLIYLIDGQGHGVSAALTIFGVVTTIKSIIKEFKTFPEFIERLFNEIKKFLDTEEQLSFSFIYFNDNQIEYAIGGMYPAIVKSNKILKLKSNNPPFVNNQKNRINIYKIDTSFKKILLYSDGLIEEELLNKKYNPINLIEDNNLLNELDKISQTKDDLTILLFDKS